MVKILVVLLIISAFILGEYSTCQGLKMSYSFDYGSCKKLENKMPTEFEVRQFIRMNAHQKSKMFTEDKPRYLELKEAADKLFPINDDSNAVMGEVTLKDGEK